MDKDAVIDILFKFAAASLSIVGVMIVGIVVWMRNKIEGAATKLEVIKVESDLKQTMQEHKRDRERRDDEVDKKLGRIEDVVTRTHLRIDQLFSNGSHR